MSYLRKRNPYSLAMINRDLIRIKVVQLLFANQINPDELYLKKVRKEDKANSLMGKSLSAAYELYCWLLQLIIEIHCYAEKRIELSMSKHTATKEDLNPNRRFIENRFALQLASNKQLKELVKKFHISWAEDSDLIRALYKEICNSQEYKDYMDGKIPADAPSTDMDDYTLDKFFWRQIIKKVIAVNEALGDSLEEMNLYWNDDAETILSFVEKTIKRFNEAEGADQQLLPKYNDESDEEFAYDLYKYALQDHDKCRELIDNTVKNWKLERMTLMDLSIMQAAIAELTHFPSIPVPVTLNEYIEISKYYSTSKSYEIINGILDNLVKQLSANGQLSKIKTTKE